jgi:hypothetical protein
MSELYVSLYADTGHPLIKMLYRLQKQGHAQNQVVCVHWVQRHHLLC